ncbi:MAG: NrpR regulatory domain-containing protein [Candidatus Hydrogenedentes bacterium]|nr:NrpR regulatory domain-containing protein [Candidatus Hydrogenedentota bacterium]
MKSFREIKVKRQLHAILQVLANADEPVGSEKISDLLRLQGINLTDRAVRVYLEITDRLNLTKSIGRKGRIITEKGIEEIESAVVIDKVGFISSKIEELSYQMDFNLETKKGSIILNVSAVKKKYLTPDIVQKILRAFEKNLGMGKLITFANENEKIGNFKVPPEHVGIGTVCSVTLNGIFLKNHVHMTSRYGCLLELENRKPKRFTQLINYEGTTIDPLEIFIRGKMTSIWKCVTSGNGLLGASFREIPSIAINKARELAKKANDCFLGGILTFGEPNQPVLDVPVPQGKTGLIILAGLNPIAIISEEGMEVSSKALCGLHKYEDLYFYKELAKFCKKLK